MTSFSASTSDVVTGTDVLTRALASPRRLREEVARRVNPALPVNIIQNPSFDDASTTKWYGIGASTQYVYTTADFVYGAKSVLVNPQLAGFLGVGQDVEGVLPGRTYVVSAWLRRLKGVGGIYTYFFWRDQAGNTSALPGTSLINVTSSWQRFSWTYVAPASTSGMLVGWAYPGTQAGIDTDGFYVDGVQMELGTSPTDFEAQAAYDTLTMTAKTSSNHTTVVTMTETAQASDVLTSKALGSPRKMHEECFVRRNPVMPANLVSNPSFESPASGAPWFTTGPTKYWAIVGTDFYDGVSSAFINPLLPGQTGIEQYVPVTPGQAYNVSVWLKRQKGATNPFIYAFWLDAAGNKLSNVTFPVLAAGNVSSVSTISTGAWSRNVWKTVAAPAGATTLDLSFSISPAGSDTDALWLDAVQVEAGDLTDYESYIGPQESLTYTYKAAGGHATTVSMRDNAFATDTLVRKLTAPRLYREIAASRVNTSYPVNLVRDADIEDGFGAVNGTDGWQTTGASTTWSKSTDFAHSGTQSIKMAPPSGFVGIQQLIVVSPNTTYTFSVWARRGTGVATFQSYFFWADFVGAAIGGQVGVPVTFNPDNSWRRYSWTLTSPSQARHFIPAFVYPGTAAGADTMYLDDWQMEVGATASPFDPVHTYDTLVTSSKVGLVYQRPLTEVAYSNGYYIDDTVARATAHPRATTESLTTSDSPTKRLAFPRQPYDYGKKNVVLNPKLTDTGVAGFFVNGSDYVATRDTSFFHTSPASLKVTPGTTIGNGLQTFSVGCEPNTAYTISVWCYFPSGHTFTSLNIGVNMFTAVNSVGYRFTNTLTPQTIVNDTWVQYTYTLATIIGHPELNAINVLVQPIGGNGTFYVDDVQIERGAAATTLVDPNYPDALTRASSSPRTMGDSADKNYAQNRGFEDSAQGLALYLVSNGDQTIALDGTRVHSGTQSVKVTGGTVVGTIQNRSVYCGPGETVTFSAWIYLPSGCGVAATGVGVQFFTKSLSQGILVSAVSGVVDNAPTFDTWVQYTVTATVPASAVAVNGYIGMGGLSPGASIWVDDWVIQQGNVATAMLPDDAVTFAQGHNRVSGDFGRKNMQAAGQGNYSFEDTDILTPYFAAVGTTIARDTSHSRSGLASLKLTSSGIRAYMQSYSIASEPGAVYTVSAWLYVPSGMGVTQIQLGLSEFQRVHNDGLIFTPGTETDLNVIPLDQWFRVSYSTAMNVAAGSINIFIVPLGLLSGASVWIDDIQIEAGSVATSVDPLESLTQQLSASRSVTDLSTLVETVSRYLTSVRAPGVEMTTVADAMARSFLTQRFPADVTTLADMASVLATWLLQTTDATTVADLVGLRLLSLRSLSEHTTVSDLLRLSRSLQLDLFDVVQAVDSVTRHYLTNRVVADAVAVLTDVLTQLITWPRQSLDTTTVTEQLLARIVTARLVADSAPASDASGRALRAGRATVDSVPSPTESVARTLSLVRSVVDTLVLSEVLARVLVTSRDTTDVMTWVDALVALFLPGRRLKHLTADGWVPGTIRYWDGSQWTVPVVKRQLDGGWVRTQ